MKIIIIHLLWKIGYLVVVFILASLFIKISSARPKHLGKDPDPHSNIFDGIAYLYSWVLTCIGWLVYMEVV